MGKLAGNIFFLNDDELEKLHQNSLKILHEIGFHVPNNKILDLLDKNNCTVDYEKQIVNINQRAH